MKRTQRKSQFKNDESIQTKGTILAILASISLISASIKTWIMSLCSQDNSYRREIGAWFFQMCASLAWVISMVTYNSWENGDIFQIIAASAWTLSNLLSLPDLFPMAQVSSVELPNRNASNKDTP